LGGGPSNPTYGDLRDPNDVGSGGCTTSATRGGNGGGLVRIVANVFQLDGSIVASGGVGDLNAAGGGGGGIRIDVETIQGTGSIIANGGNAGGRVSGGPPSGGGGGRVAVFFQNATGFNFSNVSAFGGAGGGAGGAGTVYLQGPGRETGELVVDNNNIASATQSTPILSSSSGLLNLTNFNLRGAARVRLDDQLNVTGTLEISTGAEFLPVKRVIASRVNLNNGALITHLPTTATAFFKVDLSADNLIVDATSRIDVTARGFLGRGQPGNPIPDRGMTLGFQAGSAGRGGGEVTEVWVEGLLIPPMGTSETLTMWAAAGAQPQPREGVMGEGWYVLWQMFFS